MLAAEPETCWGVSTSEERNLISCPGLSAERTKRYLALLGEMEAESASRMTEGRFKGGVLIGLDSGFRGSKCLLFSRTPPEQVLANLDDPELYRREGQYYRRLSDAWYVSFESHRWRG